MLLFLLLLLPICLFFFWFTQKVYNIVPMILVGSITALFVCGFKTFFLFSHKIIMNSFGLNFLQILILQTSLPVLLLYGLYFLIDHDSIKLKIESFLPLLLSFYSIYLPCVVISSTDSVYSGFQIFVKPYVFALMLFQLSFCIEQLYANMQNKNKVLILVNVIIMVAYFCIPALLEAYYLTELNIVVLTAGVLICSVFTLLYLLLIKLKRNI